MVSSIPFSPYCLVSVSLCSSSVIPYGLGFGLGTSFGLVFTTLTALAVFILQIGLSRLWLRYFSFGPLEWLWRLLTYGRYFPICRN